VQQPGRRAAQAYPVDLGYALHSAQPCDRAGVAVPVGLGRVAAFAAYLGDEVVGESSALSDRVRGRGGTQLVGLVAGQVGHGGAVAAGPRAAEGLEPDGEFGEPGHR
jgi:hypothetical protein